MSIINYQPYTDNHTYQLSCNILYDCPLHHREIEELKEKYESKLSTERESSLRLKGENGIMRKKFNALQKDIEAQKEEIKNLFEQKRELYATIASLEKDIASLKREIRERDETIGDKVNLQPGETMCIFVAELHAGLLAWRWKC